MAPDVIRLGELEAHLGDRAIEKMVSAAPDVGRLPPRHRCWIMSYPMAGMPVAAADGMLVNVAGTSPDLAQQQSRTATSNNADTPAWMLITYLDTSR